MMVFGWLCHNCVHDARYGVEGGGRLALGTILLLSYKGVVIPHPHLFLSLPPVPSLPPSLFPPFSSNTGAAGAPDVSWPSKASPLLRLTPAAAAAKKARLKNFPVVSLPLVALLLRVAAGTRRYRKLYICYGRGWLCQAAQGPRWFKCTRPERPTHGV